MEFEVQKYWGMIAPSRQSNCGQGANRKLASAIVAVSSGGTDSPTGAERTNPATLDGVDQGANGPKEFYQLFVMYHTVFFTLFVQLSFRPVLSLFPGIVSRMAFFVIVVFYWVCFVLFFFCKIYKYTCIFVASYSLVGFFWV